MEWSEVSITRDRHRYDGLNFERMISLSFRMLCHFSSSRAANQIALKGQTNGEWIWRSIGNREVRTRVLLSRLESASVQFEVSDSDLQSTIDGGDRSHIRVIQIISIRIGHVGSNLDLVSCMARCPAEKYAHIYLS
jgi:hypothetical protein